MSDRELRQRRLAAVRLSFAAVSEFERHARRTDNLMILGTFVAIVVLSFFTQTNALSGLWLGLAYALGTFAGGVIWQRASRRREWCRLKSMYDEIELQNMIAEETEDDS